MKSKESTLKTILVSIITAIIVSAINYYIWRNQNSIEQNQNLYNYKIELLEKHTKSSLTMISLFEYKARIRLEYLKIEAKIRDSLNIKMTEKLPYNYTADILRKLQAKYPFEYSKHMDCLKFQDETISNYTLVRMFYNDSVINSVNELEYSFKDHSIGKFIVSEMEKKNVEIENVDGDEIVRLLHKNQWKKLIESLHKMSPEIDPSKN